MSSFQNNGIIEYKFNNEEDFAFYILNAVAHDFIHDFNNYGRMGKILNYIMSLVDFRTSQALASAASNLSSLEAADRTPDTNTSSLVSSAPDDGDVPINLDSIEPPTPQGDDNLSISTEATTDSEAFDIPTSELCRSQMEDNYEQPISTDISVDEESDPRIQEIVNTNIEVYNSITSTINHRAGCYPKTVSALSATFLSEVMENDNIELFLGENERGTLVYGCPENSDSPFFAMLLE